METMMSIPISTEPFDEENRIIEQLEEEIEETEYRAASEDLEHVLHVNGSLKGVLNHQRTAQHLIEFMWKERCEESIRFWKDVETYKASFKNQGATSSQRVSVKIR